MTSPAPEPGALEPARAGFLRGNGRLAVGVLLAALTGALAWGAVGVLGTRANPPAHRTFKPRLRATRLQVIASTVPAFGRFAAIAVLG